jgi:hypothetical protein
LRHFEEGDLSDPSFEHRVFRIAPELCRSLYYAIAGAILLSSVAWWVESTVKLHAGVHVVSVVFALVGLLTIYPLSWRLELDGEGLVRRRLGLRDDWRWDDFASGRVEKHYQFMLLDPERPWWRRKLVLDSLLDADRQQVLAALNRHYRLPAAPPLPESLTIRFRLNGTATFARHGIQVAERGQPADYRWADVQHLHIARGDALRRDFAELNLVLPVREIELRMVTHQGGTSPTWRGATAEEINNFLLAHVPEERVSVDTAGQRPHAQRDVEREAQRLRGNLKQFALGMAVCGLLSFGALVWLAVEGPLIRTLWMIVPFALVALVAWAIWRRQVHELRTLELWRDELQSQRQVESRRPEFRRPAESPRPAASTR